MATLDDVLNAIGRHENRGVRAGGEMTEHAIGESDAAVAPAGYADRLDTIVADCDDYERRYEQGDFARHDSQGRHDEHIGWDAMVRKLEGEGHSKESAEKIAGAINAKKHHLG